MADRRQRKLEKKKKKRETAKKRVRAEMARRPSDEERLIRSAARCPFGPCAINLGWNDEGVGPPSLVTVVVTRALDDEQLLPTVAMVDRTCLGVKDGFVMPPLSRSELPELLERIYRVHGGVEDCEPLVAQSVVFHAVDYARRLGFEPHPDAELSLFEPRPAELLATAWHAAEHPMYVSGPDDDVDAIVARLEAAVGADNFDVIRGDLFEDFDDDDATAKM
jgi:hypothetical protein